MNEKTTIAPELQPLASDVAQDISLIKQVASDVKAGGVQAALKDIPQAVSLVETEYEDVKKALPLIKAGYKSTEFWLVLAFFLGNVAYTAFTGKNLPFDTDLVLGGVLAVYTAARGLIKTKASAPSVTVVNT